VTWPGAEIAGIYSRTTDTVEKIGGYFNVDFRTNDLDALIAKKLDAVLVLTHTDSHFDLVRRLLNADIDVYVEKPATTASSATQELADLANAQERIFMVGFNRRYAPLFQKAKDIFGSNPIRLCMVEKHRSGIKPRDLFQTYLDDTVHQIDLLRYFCGDVQAIHTSCHLEEGKLRSAVSLTTLPSGGLGVVQTSREAGMWQERVTIHGGELTVEVSAFRELCVKYPDHEEVYGADRAGRWMPQLTERGFSGEIQHFFECVRTRQIPMTDGYDSVRTQRLLEDMVAKASTI
jgi:virulence factor